MLTSTYVHAPGIGPATEQSLWAQGATCWDLFLQSAAQLRLPKRHSESLRVTVEESIEAFNAQQVGYFARRLPKREHWRAVRDFPKLGFLDIETDGGMDADSITIIGLSDGFDVQVYQKGKNLAQFADDCREYDGFVTFFGAGFDIPFLSRRFPSLQPVFAERLHVDLCPLLKRLGYSGGLKRIEQTLGIVRVPETEGLSGYDAVRLWHLYRRGGPHGEEALRLLCAYNREDVANMKTLLEFALPKMRAAAGHPELAS